MGEGEKLVSGTRVELREAMYGYEAGTPGLVVSTGDEEVLVRFDPTGHALFVAPRHLRPA